MAQIDYKTLLAVQQQIGGFKAVISQLALMAQEGAETIAKHQAEHRASPELFGAVQNVESYLRYISRTDKGRLPVEVFKTPLGKLQVWAWLALYGDQLVGIATAARVIFGLYESLPKTCFARLLEQEEKGVIMPIYQVQLNGVGRWFYRLDQIQDLHMRPPRVRKKAAAPPPKLPVRYYRPALPPI